jgi:hypothetical protein
MKKITLALLIILIVILLNSIVIQANPIDVKDYIKDKFPLTFSLYLSSLEELDEAEKEFIDLLEQLPTEDQNLYVKKVYKEGFNPKMITEIKEVLQKEYSKEYVLDVFYWGMSKQEAENILKDKDFKQTKVGYRNTVTIKGKEYDYEINSEGLYYQGHIGRTKLLVTLGFYKDELIQVVCLFSDDTYESLNDYIKEYEVLKNYLVEKYNTPTEEGINWKKDEYRNRPEKWGLAVRKEDLSYFTKWNMPKTTVIIELGGWKDKINLMAVFRSKKFEEIEKEIIDSLEKKI